MKRRLRLLTVITLAPMMMLSVAGVRLAVAQTPPPAQEQPTQAGQTWTATMGHEVFTEPGEKSTWQVDRFYPETITINVGDSILWEHDSGSNPHTVSLLGADNEAPGFVIPECNGGPCPPPPAGGEPPAGPPPGLKLLINPLVMFKQGPDTYDGTAYVNSGVIAANIPGPKEYKLTFAKPGTYTYVCLIHAIQLPNGEIFGMQGKVVVQAAGSAYPKTQAQVDAEAEAMRAADEQEAIAAEPQAKRASVSSRPGAGGGMVHRVNSGFLIHKGTYDLDFLRFGPAEIVVQQGDTIEWSIPTPHGFHNVIFGDEPDPFQIEPQPSGPPKVYFNLNVALPVGANPATYRGTGVYSSGILVGTEDPPEAGIKMYSLTFAEPGRFEYVCGVHYNEGMAGSVVVRARTGQTGAPPVAPPGGPGPGMPRTGQADNWLMLLALSTALAFVFTGATLRVRRSRLSK